jgi:hypothetical protein
MIVDMEIEKHTLNKRKHDACIIMTMTTSKRKNCQTLLLMNEIDLIVFFNILCKFIFF